MVLAAILERILQVIPVVGIPVLQNHERLQRVLDSIDYPIDKLVILDQSGKANWKPKKPKHVKQLIVWNFPHAMGVATSWNIIIKGTPFASHWIFFNDDIELPEGSLQILAEAAAANTDKIVIPRVARFSAFSIGEGVIEKLGLFDELFFPMYYEDTDYLHRCWHTGTPILEIDCPVHHETSSTINRDGYSDHNNHTFPKLHNYHIWKLNNGRYDSGDGWSLRVRRENSWGK
jgi:GT2 family glycosyltransferase